MSDAPEFALLEARGPRPGALLLSFSFSSALLVMAVVLARPLSPAHPWRPEDFSEIVIARGPLWLPVDPPLNPSHSAGPIIEPDPPAQESHSRPEHSPPPEATVRADLPAAALPRLQMSGLPLPSSDVLSPSPKLPSPPAVASHPVAAEAPQAAPSALGALPLPQLIEREGALAAGLAALPPDQRHALPRLSIRVNAEWLEALPLTKEELYFSVTAPQEDSEVLAYSPATHSFTLKRPLRPLWQIQEGERVPALAALRSAAAHLLGVSPDLVGLYTWHPPVLENALRMFVRERMQQMRVLLGPADVVTVRFASGPDGYLMTLEPIQASAPQ